MTIEAKRVCRSPLRVYVALLKPLVVVGYEGVSFIRVGLQEYLISCKSKISGQMKQW